MSLEKDLENYQTRSLSLIEDSPQMDEQNTKRKVIEPLIELLGWDILSKDVELEYSLQIGSGTKKVDYALILEGTPVVFVEAKGCDSPLDESHGSQLRSYMRQVGVEWGLLSNGRRFKIFRRDYSSNKPNEISLAEFPIEDILRYHHPLKALTKESISSGESGRIAEKIEKIKVAVDTLKNDKEGIAEDITRLVSKRVGESVSQMVEDEAKSFVDEIIATLEEQAHTRSVQVKPQRKVTKPSENGYTIRLLDDGVEVGSFSESTQAKTTASMVEYLIQEEGLLQQINLPYVPGTGRGTRALLNDEPVHTDGREMREYQTLEDGYFLHTSLSADDKIRYISELTEKVELECEFGDGW